MAYDKLADAIIKHSKLIMVIWIVVLLVAAVPAAKAFSNMSYDMNEMGIEESESMEGYGIIATYFPSSSADTSSSPILVIAYGNDDEHVLAQEVDGIISGAVDEGLFTYTTADGEEAIKNGLADEIVVGNEVLGRVLELGGKMDGEKYKAQVLEIAQLCKLAHAEHKIADFIAQDLSADQVKRQLLDAMSVQQEISNANYQKEATLGNPVIAAAKQRAVASKNLLH